MRAILACAALAAAVLAPPAQADTLIAAAPQARNLAQGGGWLAWAEPAELSPRWRLVVRSPAGVTSRPAIADFFGAPDPSIGSDRFGISGRRLFVVYSRCVAYAECDVYRYDLTAGTERKVTAISTPTASETAPALRNGLWSFVRRGPGVARRGVYVYTPRGGVRRLSSLIARETAVSASRVAYAYGPQAGGRGGGVAVRRFSGRGGVVSAVAGLHLVPSSLVATRYKFGWLIGKQNAIGVVWTSRLSGRATSVTLHSSPRNLSSTTNSITTNDRVPDKYLDAVGIWSLSPSLF
jgi:hypothetical protein